MRFTLRTGTSRHKRVQRRAASFVDPPPAVTVVILSHNYGRFLGPCAESALAQRDAAVQVLIMDDCSTDSTPEVSARLAASDPRVTVIRNPSNRGQIPTMNDAFARVDTKYVVKMDADDLLPPGALARATAFLEAHPEASFVYGRPHHFSGPPPEFRDASTRSWTIWPGKEWVAARCRSGANVITQPEVVMRTSALLRACPVREELDHTFDMHLWLRLALLGDVGRINGPAQGLYRVHDASMQRTIHAGVMLDLEGRRDAFAALFNDNATAPSDAAELHRIARRGLAITALEYACRAYDRGRTDEKPVDELVAFALTVSPDTRELQEWKAFQHRQAVGTVRAARHPRFFADALTRRISEELGHWNWLRTGEL